MALYPKAKLRLLPENETQPSITPTQVILHSAVDAPGPTSLFPYFSRVDVVLESTFFIKLDGVVEQYMDTEVRADANYHANRRPDGTGAISIETEDDGNPNQRPWTEAQLKAIEELLEWIWKTHKTVPRRVCASHSGPGIGYHSMWGAPSEWTPVEGKTCPGTIRIKQWNEVIVPWINSPAFTPKEHGMAQLIRNQESGAVLFVDGLLVIGINNTEDYSDFRAKGFPEVSVIGSLFNRFNAQRVDV